MSTCQSTDTTNMWSQCCNLLLSLQEEDVYKNDLISVTSREWYLYPTIQTKKTPNQIKTTNFNIYIFSPFSWQEYGVRILQRGIKAAGYMILFFILFVVILLLLASSGTISDSNCNLWMVAFEFLEPYGELSYIVTPVFWSTYMVQAMGMDKKKRAKIKP